MDIKSYAAHKGLKATEDSLVTIFLPYQEIGVSGTYMDDMARLAFLNSA